MTIIPMPRRAMILMGLSLVALAGCGGSRAPSQATPGLMVPAVYRARKDGERTIPAVNPAYLNERNRRTWVDYTGPEEPGSIVVDPYARVLYHVVEPGRAMRFGVAVGKAGRGFSGDAVVRRKEEYPYWAPTKNMIRTEPDLYGPLAAGLPGGLDNPLGARALYLYRNGRDTYYRIHGTMDPSSIGKATSAGCIRLFNQDIIDLFDEAELGTKVHVRSRAESLDLEGPMVELHTGYVVPESDTAAIEADRRAWEAGEIPDLSEVEAEQYQAAVQSAEERERELRGLN
ncbi:L,D-transpeptidase [Paenirhodobacter populi]